MLRNCALAVLRIAVLALSVLFFGYKPAWAGTDGLPTTVRVFIGNEGNVPVSRTIRRAEFPYRVLFFGTQVSSPAPEVIIPGSWDFYFGGILPNGERFSWVRDDAGAVNRVVAGVTPLASGVAGKSDFSAQSLTGQLARHYFTEADMPGTYFLLSIVVRPGSDPSDPANWVDYGTNFFILE